MKQYTRKQLKEYARLGLARDLLPVEMFSYIADTPKGLHAAALETARFELEAVQL